MSNAMNTTTRLVRALVPLWLLALHAPTSMAQAACTPMVYAFRHAEDSNHLKYPNTLTKTGLRHADLYVSMLNNINAALGSNHCPVTKVYAINTTKADGISGNTWNPFLTAIPLAKSRMAGAEPIQNVSSYKLLEFLDNNPDPRTNTASKPFFASYTTPTASALRAELVRTATTLDGQSSAIFGTSQGLHILSGAIIGAESRVPQKNIDDGKTPATLVVFKAGTPIGTPPRNAAYLFAYNKDKNGFDDVVAKATSAYPFSNLHVQCYNWTITSPDSATAFRANFWCGDDEFGDLGGNPKVTSQICDAALASVRAQICNTDTLMKKGSAYYGYCINNETPVSPPACN